MKNSVIVVLTLAVIEGCNKTTSIFFAFILLRNLTFILLKELAFVPDNPLGLSVK